MAESGADSAPGLRSNPWTLIRGARQLLTLRGADGPRRRSSLSDLSIVADGAVLIRDGIIHEIGTSRRVENMEAARSAREIDATGKIVMPAFVDPDFCLASPVSPGEPDIRRMSRTRLEDRATALACDAVRYGVATIGANTLAAPDLHNTLRALRVYRTLHLKPARICPIVSPSWRSGVTDCAAAVSRRHLASMFEIEIDSGALDVALDLAKTAAAAAFDIRFRATGAVTSSMADLASKAGCISMIGSGSGGDCLQVLTGSQLLGQDCSSVRGFVESGGALALASGYQRGAETSMNPQYLLFAACRNAGLSIEEAITAITYNAACALGVARETGSLAPGKSADFCIVDVPDYHELAGRPGHHDVWMVMCGGRVIYRRAAPSIR